MTTQSGHSKLMRSKAFAKARELKAQRRLEKELAKKEKVIAQAAKLAEQEASMRKKVVVTVGDDETDGWILENTSEYEPPVVHMESRGRPRKTVVVARYQYASTVLPLDGKPILIGPFKRKNAVMDLRMKTVKKLIEQGNARESDIKQLELYEAGYFNDDDNDK